MSITHDEMLFMCDLVHDLCGIHLDSSKSYLIESRLRETLQKAQCNSFTDLAKVVKSGLKPELRTEIINAITTNETLFFRDSSPFRALQFKALPEAIDAQAKTPFPKRIRIWSAACSTGQEPYSIAMVVRDLIPDVDQWQITILATDISDQAIQRASRGVYAKHEIERGLDPVMRSKYFVEENGGWRVRDEIRSMVSFRRLNLLETFQQLGQFEIVFCRNVAIYFRPDVRKQLFNRIADQLPRHGYLFVGSSESLHDLGPRFNPENHCGAVFYRPNMPAGALT